MPGSDWIAIVGLIIVGLGAAITYGIALGRLKAVERDTGELRQWRRDCNAKLERILLTVTKIETCLTAHLQAERGDEQE